MLLIDLMKYFSRCIHFQKPLISHFTLTFDKTENIIGLNSAIFFSNHSVFFDCWCQISVNQCDPEEYFVPYTSLGSLEDPLTYLSHARQTECSRKVLVFFLVGE